MKALKESKAPIPEDLISMAKEHAEKVKRGEARAHGSGYGGSGFKFDTAEEDKEQAKKKVRTCCIAVRGSCALPCTHAGVSWRFATASESRTKDQEMHWLMCARCKVYLVLLFVC